MASPIIPDDLNPINTGTAACDALKTLLQTRTDMREFLAWMLEDDSTGELNDSGFLTDLAEQFLFDAAKKGFFVRSNPTTGRLELIEKVALADIDDENGTDGDMLVLESGVWTRVSPFYGAPTSGGATVPVETSGGTLTAAHGVGTTPNNFRAILECNAADLNYAVGDRVDALSLMFLDSSVPEIMPAVTVFADASLVGVTFRDGGVGDEYQLHNRSTFAKSPIQVSKWNVMLYAAR